MLFSDVQVAKAINAQFEPVWESVRPVPTVRIDFGNGKQITRTLHGNIATYLCASDGQVLDILPGIYAPDAYLTALGQFAYLPKYLHSPESTEEPAARLVKYHRLQAQSLAQSGRPAIIYPRPLNDFAKAMIEGRIKYLLHMPPAGETSGSAPAATVEVGVLGDGADWRLLVEDTRFNERTRRHAIHERLANSGAVKPEQITRWLYKDVLHADLDDPYLGLGPLLFANYPFKEKPQ